MSKTKTEKDTAKQKELLIEGYHFGCMARGGANEKGHVSRNLLAGDRPRKWKSQDRRFTVPLTERNQWARETRIKLRQAGCRVEGDDLDGDKLCEIAMAAAKELGFDAFTGEALKKAA